MPLESTELSDLHEELAAHRKERARLTAERDSALKRADIAETRCGDLGRLLSACRSREEQLCAELSAEMKRCESLTGVDGINYRIKIEAERDALRLELIESATVRAVLVTEHRKMQAERDRALAELDVINRANRNPDPCAWERLKDHAMRAEAERDAARAEAAALRARVAQQEADYAKLRVLYSRAVNDCPCGHGGRVVELEALLKEIRRYMHVSCGFEGMTVHFTQPHIDRINAALAGGKSNELLKGMGNEK